MIAVSSGEWASSRFVCSTALRAAAMPSCAARSVAVAVPVDMNWSGSKPFTRAICVKRTPGLPSGAPSTLPMGAMPVMPEKSEWVKSSIVLPMGVTQPRPVTTTRFTIGCLLLEELGCGAGGIAGGSCGLLLLEHFDAFDHIADGLQAAERVVGNFDVEGLLDLERDVDLVERVDVQLFKRAVQSDGLGRDALRLGDDLDAAAGDVVHGGQLSY